MVDFRAPLLCQIEDCVYKGMVLQTMAIVACQYPCLKMFYDPKQRAVGASIEIPLLDMELSQKTFWFCLNQLINWLDEFVPRLQSVMATGIDPGKKSAWEQLLDRMPAESIEELAQLIAQRQKQGGNRG
jgi:hypothetical protein